MKKILAALALGIAAAAHAQPLQPRIVNWLPAPNGEVDSGGVIAVRLAHPMQGKPQAVCDVWGIRSSVPVDVLQGAKRDEALRKAGVPDAEIDAAAEQPWMALRCLSALPDGAWLNLRWMRPERAGRDDPALPPGVWESWDGLRAEFRARSQWPLVVTCTRSTAGAGCNPLERVVLQFNREVSAADLAKVRLKGADGKLVAPRNQKELASGELRWANMVEFARLKPNQRYTVVWPVVVADPQGADALERTRKLAPLVVTVGAYPPLVKFGANFGIAEKAEGGVVPITVRSVEGVEAPSKLRSVRLTDPAAMVLAYQELSKVTAADDSRARHAGQWGEEEGMGEGEQPQPTAAVAGKKYAYAFPFPKPDARLQDTRAIAWLRPLKDTRSQLLPRKLEGREFEVLGVPLREPGLYLLEVESRALGRGLLDSDRPMFVRSGALVTDLGVHMHLSHRAMSVWVTRLSSGQPVPGAEVAIYNCRAQRLAGARTGADGWVIVDQPLPTDNWACPLYAFATLEGDTSFVQNSWQHGIETWRFEALNAMYSVATNRVVHAVLARNLLRPGETLNARLYWRQIGNRGTLEAPPAGTLPRTIDIVHLGSGERRSVPVTWDERGNADLTLALPSGIKRGPYNIAFGGNDGRGIEFRVEDFRLPVLKAEVVTPGRAQVMPPIVDGKPAHVNASVRLAYLSGGPAGGERVQVFQRLAPFTPRFEEWPEFWFGESSRYRWEDESSEEALGTESESTAVGEDKSLRLDANGTAQVAARFDKPLPAPRVLVTEMEYRDPNGETYRAQGRTQVWPASMVLGVKAQPWSAEPQRSAEFVAVGPDGKPVANAAVVVEGGFDGWVAYRRKSVGGFYGYSSERREFKPAALCSGRTDARGLFTCRFSPDMANVDSGEYRVQAIARDAQGRAARVATSVWVYSGGELWFGQSDHDRIDVLADKARYKPGETATLQVRSPFREAQAWVSVLRGGVVVHTLVVPIRGTRPTIQLPIKASYAPNMFVNVLVVRGRVAGPAPTALVDLARPAYKLGIVPLEVGSDEQLLKVQVRTDRTQYQSRETARVDIKVTPNAGALPAQREVTVFAVDEALLELLPNGTWDVFKAMTAKQGYGFETASAQMQVIGKRHFGRKALPPGGGGGKSAARELFDTLLLWRGSVPIADDGTAHVDVPINDSLTRFRVVAVANAGTDRFGTGEASFVATRDLQVLPGLPATLREGERFNAGFTLRNTTGAAMQVNVGGTVDGKALAAQKVTLAAGESKGVSWWTDVPRGVPELKWRVEASATTAQGARSDAVAIRQAVNPTLLQVRYASEPIELQPQGRAQLTLQPPAGSILGRGELRVSLSPALAADAAGVREYMRSYPFYCLEQRTSKAVSLKDKALWAIITDGIDGYIMPTGLVTYYPGGGDMGYDILTSFVLSASHEAGWALPEDAQRRMLDGLEQFVRGKVTIDYGYYHGDAIELTERKLLALEAIARHRKADPALAESLHVDAKELPSLSHRALIEWIDVLNRTSWPRKDARMAEALKELDARLVGDGRGGLRLRERPQEHRWYFMASEPTSQVRLALLALDVPALSARANLLAQAAVNMQQHGNAWWETQANVWGSLMLDKRAVRAQGAVAGQTVVSIGSASQVHDWATSPQGSRLVFPAAGVGPQQPAVIRVQHRGGGKPAVQAAGTAWSDLRQPQERHAQIARAVRLLKQAVPGQWSVGDIAEVRVTFSMDRHSGWMVLSDPIPSGATLLGNGLKGQAMVTEGASKRGWRNEDGSWEAWPRYVERTFTHVRAYYEYFWGDKMTFTYQVRINNAGRFNLPPTQFEAMYDPDIYAYRPNAPMEVK